MCTGIELFSLAGSATLQLCQSQMEFATSRKVILYLRYACFSFSVICDKREDCFNCSVLLMCSIVEQNHKHAHMTVLTSELGPVGSGIFVCLLHVFLN